MPFPAKASKCMSYSKKCLWGPIWYKLQKKRWRAPPWLKHRATCTLTRRVLTPLSSASSSALLLKYEVLVKIASPTSHLGHQIEKPGPLKRHLKCNWALRKTPIIQSHRTTEYYRGRECSKITWSNNCSEAELRFREFSNLPKETQLGSSHCCVFILICLMRSINVLTSINLSFMTKLGLGSLILHFIITVCLSISLCSSLSPDKFNKGRIIIIIILFF